MKLRTYTKEFKKNLNLAYPVMLGQLGHILVGFADNIMVGKLGAAPLAAVSLVNSVVFIAFSVGIGFTLAITPLIAEADGEKDHKKGRQYFRHGVLLSTILGILLCGVLFIVKPFLSQMGQPEEVVTYGMPYYDLIAYSMIPLLVFQAYKQFADGLSFTVIAMKAALYANLLNVILNYLLIYGTFGFPRLELVGAGWGTLISRVFMLILIMWMVYRKPAFKPYLQKFSFKTLNKKVTYKIIELGYPSALQMFFEIGIFGTAILLAGVLGTIPQAANQIALNLATMTYMIAIGLGVTATVRVGNQKGLKDYVSLRNIGMSVFLLMVIIDVFFALAFIVFKDFMPLWYINDPAVIAMASNLLIVAGLFQISDGVQVVFLGALRGLQDVKKPTWITFVSYWVIGFPICYFLGLKTDMGAVGIWIGLLGGLTASAILLYLRFDKLSKKYIKQNS